MSVLTEQDRRQFLDKGYVVVHDCFTHDQAQHLIDRAWVRLGYDPSDPATWAQARIHMPRMASFRAADFAPRAWDAACELAGGADRIEPWSWGDSFIVTLDEGADEPWSPPDGSHGKWHKDGDFFRHFLDSPEQGLLSLVIWTDIDHQGSATYAATDSVPVVARFLAAHPDGVPPRGFDYKSLIGECREFVECTGRCGDVFLLHPYMLHSGSQNMLRRPRFLTNPPVHLKEPMNFNRANPADFSLIEKAVLHGLGVERLDFRPTGERERIVPERTKEHAKVLDEQRERLAAAGMA